MARTTRLTWRARTTAAAGATVIQRPDPEVWSLALSLAEGDHRLLEVSPDGRTVKVHNR